MSTISTLNAKLSKQLQTTLQKAGFYFGVIDGDIGPKSRGAARAWASTDPAITAKLDPRSFAFIHGGTFAGKMESALHQTLRPITTRHICLLRTLGLDARIISGYRNNAEQQALYNKGRTTSGKIVTKARPGFSNHNFRLAYDIGLFVDEDCIPDDVTSNDEYVEESGLYLIGGEIGKRCGLDWGGDWKSIVDTPHFQLKPAWAEGMSESKMLGGMRARVAAGKDVLAA